MPACAVAVLLAFARGLVGARLDSDVSSITRLRMGYDSYATVLEVVRDSILQYRRWLVFVVDQVEVVAVLAVGACSFPHRSVGRFDCV